MNLANDLFSFNKELIENGAIMNYIRVLYNDNNTIIITI